MAKIRTAKEEEIRSNALKLWRMMSKAKWDQPTSEYVIGRGALMSIVANMAYCDVNAEELERKVRAKVVPSGLFQSIVAEGRVVDAAELLASADFGGARVIRSKLFVTVLIPAHKRLFIGVRGTQFAYDWLINLRAFKRRSPTGDKFHSGFVQEALDLSAAIQQYRQEIDQERSYTQIQECHISGHSFGGAVAFLVKQFSDARARQFGDWYRMVTCHIYGTPRVGTSRAMGQAIDCFAIRRNLDIVPHCPPRLFGYADYPKQMLPDASSFDTPSSLEAYFFLHWIGSLALNTFRVHHNMDRYQEELLEAAGP